MLRVLAYPAPALREKSTDVVLIDAYLYSIGQQMVDTMLALHGLGLAAPQVGIGIRVIAIRDGQTSGIVLVNPVIEWMSPERKVLDEGCLSFVGEKVRVARAVDVRVRAKNLAGHEAVSEFSGLAAQAIQHEVEHLDGKLLVDHVGPAKRHLIQARAAKRGQGQGQIRP